MNFRVFVCVLIGLCAFGATGGNQQEVQATLLDHSEYRCENCLFGLNDYYFCFEAHGKILIGHEKTRTQNRLYRVTKGPDPAGLSKSGEKAIPLRFDDKYIWVSQPGSKDLRLTQDY